MSILKLADTLRLPADEAVTQKYGFIGRSGSGKSYAAMRLAELFLGAGAQIIALDWVGIWWSLRLAKNGKAVGFPHVYIFGGEHGDVDLRPESGALMADLVVDKHISVVLDVMHFRKAERTRFATAFAEQFFHRKKTARTACHLFIEEAQAYLPQLVRGEEARMVGVFEDLGKVGRNYGIGNSLISQRPQAINKDVLNQVEVLLAFQTNGPQERKAIAGWTAENTDAGATMMQDLPKLHVGDALVWSPQWLRVAAQVHISTRETYDASVTPTGRAKTIAPKTLGKADLEQLGEQIAATIEKAKAEDPKELRKEVAGLKSRAQQLERELTKAQAAPVRAATAATSDDVKRLTQEARRLRAQLEDTMKFLVKVKAVKFSTEDAVDQEALQQAVSATVSRIVAGVRDKIQAQFKEAQGLAERATRLEAAIAELLGSKVELAVTVEKQEPFKVTDRPVRPTRAPASGSGDNGHLPPAQSKILGWLAWLGAVGYQQPSKTQLALWCEVSPTSGGYFNNLGALRSAGFIEYPTGGAVSLTDSGAAIAVVPDAPVDAADMQEAICRRVGPAKAAILRAVIDVYPKHIEKDALAGQIGVSPTSGGYFNNLGALRTLGVIDYPKPGAVAALPVLFLE